MTRRTSMRDFIRENRAELEAAINAALYRWNGNGGRGRVPDPPPAPAQGERNPRLGSERRRALQLGAVRRGARLSRDRTTPRGTKMIGKFVIVRTYSAGVHTGYLEQCNGTAVLLREARRVFRWEGAFTLNEMSLNGCAEASRISDAVDTILLTQAIEVIPCTPEAEANLRRSRNGA